MLGWLCVLSFMFLLVYPRFVFFIGRPVLTKVTVEHNATLAFPSVTVCNLNKFRESAFGSNASLIRAIMADLYGYETNSVNWTYVATLDWNMSNEQQMRWLEFAAHQKDQMFAKCRWKRKEINCSEYFTTSVTDMGFCYTFNSKEFEERRGGPLLVRKSGSDHGLWLRLNAEQHEYTLSDINSAGFKVVLLFLSLYSCKLLKS